MGRCCVESVCLLSRAKHWRRNCAGTTHVVRPCFPRRQVDVCTLSLVSCFVTRPCRRCTLADQANLLAAVSRRLQLLTPVAVAAFADQAPRGQRVPFDQFRLLLIDRSAESVESFLPSRGRISRRLASTSRQLTLLTHLKTHLEALLVVTHCEPISNFTLRPSCRAGTFVVGSHCRLISSFVSRVAAVAPSSLTQAVLCSIHCPCVFCHSLHADLDAVLVLAGSGGACCPSWAVVRLLLELLHVRPQSSFWVVRDVADCVFSCCTVFSELVVFWLR